MDYSRLAYTLINHVNLESRSALPGAPVVPAPGPGRTRERLYALRGLLATALHRAAWAIEPPQPPVLPGNRSTQERTRQLTPCEGVCS